MSRFGHFLRRPLVGACAGFLAAVSATPAKAASVDLISTITVPASLQTLTPFNITLSYSNAQPGSEATDAVISTPLPANLFNVSVVGVTASHGATCPDVSDFTHVPTGVTANGAPAVQAVIPKLPTSGKCEVVLGATVLKPGSYTFGTTIDAAAGDSETLPNTNPSSTNLSIPARGIQIGIKKEVVSGATPAGTGPGGIPRFEANGWDIVYRLTYTNDSDVDLPIGVTQDQWRDQEQINSSTRPRGATSTDISCTPSDAGSVCPGIIQGNNNFALGSGTPLVFQTTNALLKAHSKMVIEYKRTYTPPACGQLVLTNAASWRPDPALKPFVPDYVEGIDGESRVQLVFQEPQPCTGLHVQWDAEKTLDRITKKDGTPVPPTSGKNIIREDGDAAHFTITLTGDNQREVPLRLDDLYRNSSAGSNHPTFFPALVAGPGSLPSVRYSVFVDGCEATGAAGAACPGGVWAGPYPKKIRENIPANSNYGGLSGVQFMLAPKAVVKLKLRVVYHIDHPDPASGLKLCRANLDSMVNTMSAAVVQDGALANGSIYTGVTKRDRMSAPLELLSDNTPRCTNLTAAKTVNNTSVASNQELEFTLTYSNSTATDAKINTHSLNAEVNPILNARVTDTLGKNFIPSAVSCAKLEGEAVAPTVSLANIMGADNTFAAEIPSMHSGGKVQCVIKGKVTVPGTYENTTEISLPQGSNLTETTLGDNFGKQNYGIIGPQLVLQKTANPTQVAVGDPATFTVVLQNVSTEAALNTRFTDPATTGLDNMAWSCVAAAGATCPAANGNGAIDHTLPSIPAGGQLTYTVTGTLAAASVTNTARVHPPAGGGCRLEGETTMNPGPCEATATVTSPTPPTPKVAVTKTAHPAAGTSVAIGGAITYTLTAQVAIAPTANELVLTDTPSTHLTIDPASFTAPAGGSCELGAGAGANAGKLICKLPAGAAIGNHTFSYEAKVAAGATGSIANHLVPTGGDNPTCAAPTDCAVNHTVLAPAPQPKVTVAKTANPANGSNVAHGNVVTYTVAVTVTNLATTAPVTLTDTLSTGLSLQGNPTVPAVGSCNAAGQVLTCQLAAGAAIGVHTFSYQAKVETTATGQVSNTVAVTGPNTDAQTCAAGCTTTHPVTVTPPPPPPPPPSATSKVMVSKSANPAAGTAVAANEQIAYAINVRVAEAATTGVLTLTDTLGAGLRFVEGSFQTPAGGKCQATGQTLRCELAAGAAVGAHTFRYQAKVDAQATGTLNNRVTANGIDKPACTECQVSHPIATVPAPVVKVSKSATPAAGSAVPAGTVLTYALKVKVEKGPTKDKVTLTDTLDAGLLYVDGSFSVPAGATCSAAGQVLTCELAAGTATGEHLFTYQAKVRDGVTGSLNNTVVAAGADQPRCTGAGDCQTTHQVTPPTVPPPATTPAVTVKKSATPGSGSTVAVGSLITYTLDVTVAQAPTTDKVTLKDTLGAGLDYVHNSFVTPAGGTCSAAGQLLTCELAAGTVVGSYTFQYQARVRSATEKLDNIVVPHGAVLDSPSCTSANDCQTSHKALPLTPPATGGSVTPVPGNAPWAMLLAMLALLGLGYRYQAHRGPR